MRKNNPNNFNSMFVSGIVKSAVHTLTCQLTLIFSGDLLGFNNLRVIFILRVRPGNMSSKVHHTAASFTDTN